MSRPRKQAKYSGSIIFERNEEKAPNKEKLIQRLKLDNVKNIILVGNPGVGKSTLLNCIIGSPLFKSGISVDGVTTKLQTNTYQDMNFIDTPGLDDIEKKKQAGKEIEKALKTHGSSKIIFIITLEGGRIRSSDVTTIRLIIDSMSEDLKNRLRYSIIINKVTKRTIELDIQDEINAKLDEVLLPKPSFITLLQENENLDGDNRLINLPHHVYQLIARTYANNIGLNDIGSIETRNWDEVQEEYHKNIEAADKKVEELKSQLRVALEVIERNKVKRYKVGEGKKVHSDQCYFFYESDSRKVEVHNYRADQLCLKCKDLT